MDYNETVEFIYNLQKFGIKLGLQRVEKLLLLIGNPHNLFHSIHIAGTNAKGSVSAIIHSILKNAGFKTGLYTSPHLIRFTERIRIDDKEIGEQEVIDYSKCLISIIKNNNIDNITFFEFVTVLSFKYFRDNKVKCAVLETGMGGRLDATNVVIPEISVITPIGLDHKEYLGDTIQQIASEKAGIIKPFVPVVVSRQEPEALKVLEMKAKQCGSAIFTYGKDFQAIVRDCQPKKIVFDFYGPIDIYGLELPLAGRHQALNAATSIMSAYLYLKKLNKEIDIENVVREGILRTAWHGRLQWISNNPDILLDGAHNVDSARVLKDFVVEHLSDRIKIFLVGIMEDKDKIGILSEILPIADNVIFTAPDYKRAAKPESLVNIANECGYHNVMESENVRDALDIAFRLIKSQNNSEKYIIIITGSLYTVGEVMEILKPNAVSQYMRCFQDQR